MKREIRKFFNDKGLQTKKLIGRNTEQLKRSEIEIGMKKVYRRLQYEPIKDVMLAREIWKEAEKAKLEKLKDEDLELEEEIIQQLTKQRDNYRDKFHEAQIGIIEGLREKSIEEEIIQALNVKCEDYKAKFYSTVAVVSLFTVLAISYLFSIGIF
jgi:phosphoenolpyruvate synthase/pyruvate phosphate dikinase